MKPEEAIENLNNAIDYLRNVKEVSKVYSAVAKLYTLVETLPSPQNEQAKEVLNVLMAMSDLEEINEKLDLLKDIIASTKKNFAKQRYFSIKRIEHLPEYKFKRDGKYLNMRKQILDTEKKIVEVEDYVDTLHEKWKHGKWAGYSHARVTGNLRIMYLYDENTETLSFVDILTKNELEKS